MARKQQQQTPRISEPSKIAYVKGVLELAQNKCLEQKLHTPDMYVAMAQQVADSYSSADSRYPKITFDKKSQRVRGQDEPVTELTATIGNETSTSYFLVRDSLPKGQKASQEELTILRPDIVSQKLATQLGIATPPPAQTSQSVPPLSELNNSAATAAVPPLSELNNAPAAATAASKAAQAAGITGAGIPDPVEIANRAPATTQAQAAPGLAGFANLANGTTPPVQTAPTLETAPDEEVNENSNPYATAAPPKTAPAPETAPTQDKEPQQGSVKPSSKRERESDKITSRQANEKMKGNSKTSKSIGKMLKDMGNGEINPLELYGETFQIIGSFLEGVPEGVNKARADLIAKQAVEIEQKRAVLKQRMDRMGESFLAAEDENDSYSEAASTQANQTSQTNPPQTNPPQTETKTAPAPVQTSVDAPIEPPKDPVYQPIEKLLESGVSVEEKLDAIEESLNKILEELKAIEQRLDAIALAQQMESQSSQAETAPALETAPAPTPGMVLETEVTTEVEQMVAPKADVPVTVVVDTDIVTESKTVPEADREVETPEVELDVIPDEEGELDLNAFVVDTVVSCDLDLELLNQSLKEKNLELNFSQDRDSFAITERSNGVPSVVFDATNTATGWSVSTELSQSKQEHLLDNLIDAIDSALELEQQRDTAQPEPQPEPQPESKEEEFCLSA